MAARVVLGIRRTPARPREVGRRVRAALAWISRGPIDGAPPPSPSDVTARAGGRGLPPPPDRGPAIRAPPAHRARGGHEGRRGPRRRADGHPPRPCAVRHRQHHRFRFSSSAGQASNERHRRAAAALAEALPAGSLHEVAGANHGGHQSHPAEFTRLMLAAVALAAEPAGPRPPAVCDAGRCSRARPASSAPPSPRAAPARRRGHRPRALVSRLGDAVIDVAERHDRRLRLSGGSLEGSMPPSTSPAPPSSGAGRRPARGNSRQPDRRR